MKKIPSVLEHEIVELRMKIHGIFSERADLDETYNPRRLFYSELSGHLVQFRRILFRQGSCGHDALLHMSD